MKTAPFLKTRWISVILCSLSVGISGCLFSPGDSSSTPQSTPSQGGNSEQQGSPPGANATPTPTGSSAADTGEAYFTNTVLPLFNQNCATCHTIPSQNPPPGAELDIFGYSGALTHLGTGGSPTNNDLYNAATGVSPHSSSGNLCTATPAICSDLQLWWSMEETASGGSGSQGPQGQMDTNSFDAEGSFTGWAADPSNPNSAITVNFYDGPLATGKNLGAAIANGFHGGVGYPGDHGFSFQVPSSYLDGNPHQLYAYAVSVSGTSAIVTGSPVTYTLYTQSTAAANYYTQMLQPALSKTCAGCHNGADFLAGASSMYYFVANDTSPPFGSTATNNLPMMMALGQNNHGGGMVCTSASASPCSLLQTWFTMAFPH